MPRSKLVAIVDDDEAVLCAVSNLVRSVGHCALGFGSGEAALCCPDFTHLNVIVSDVHMPGGMDGFTFFEAVRARRPDLPFVLMTGMADEEVAARARHGGKPGFLSKPIDDEMLIAFLREDPSSED